MKSLLQLDGDTQTDSSSATSPFYIAYKPCTKREIDEKVNKFKRIDRFASGSNRQDSDERITLPLYSRANRDRLICHLELELLGVTPEQVLLAGTALIVEDY